MTDTFRIGVADALVGEGYLPHGPSDIVVSDGVIAAIEPAGENASRRLLAVPALVDAHNHARPLSTTSFGCGDQPLERWLPNLAVMPPVDPHTATAASLARSLRGGATSVMVHLTRPMGLTPLVEEAREIARAARDVGVSIGLAISVRDRNPLVHGDHAALLAELDDAARAVVERTWLQPAPSVDEQLAAVDAVADAVHGASGTINVDVQFGPTGVQWCSDALLAGVAEASARSGRRVHMHLLETGPQRAWADRTYPDGIVTHLERLGLLSPRLTLAHCVWARSPELERLARAGARVAVNVSSNLHLHSGVAPVPAMLEAGVAVAMGLDGCALDEDDDGLRELRLFHLLNHARGFGGGGLTPCTALRAACATGRAGLGLAPGGALAVGMPADILLLDLAALDRDALMAVDPRDYLFARATRAHIVEAFAGGRRVIADGEVTGVDIAALETTLRAAYRAALPERSAVLDVWPRLGDAIAAHYRGCG